jgi:hypothetical protein
MTGDALRARAGETGTAAVPGIGAPVVLEKPLDLAALRRVVRRMLDEDSDGGRRTDG